MIIRAFEEIVERFSGKTAVRTDTGELTYEELNRYADNTARSILDSGAAAEKNGKQPMVGLLFEHGTQMIVSVLGTLKAGCAYLPLDITYPGNRLAYMVEDSETGLLLTNNNNVSLAEELASLFKNNIKIINIDTIDIPSEVGAGNIQREPSGDRLAYILYTSGSTGRPKAVMQTHENVCYYIRNWTEFFSITETDRMTLFTAFSHDGAGQDMFGALHNGATLYPYSILSKPNIFAIIQWLKSENITIWHSVPTIYRYFVTTLEERGIAPGHFSRLRAILLGGEQIREHDIRMFKRFFPNAVFANVYGQTESSVNTIWRVRHGDLVNKMLIGDPLDGTQILIVDDEGEIVEDMGMGEIVVACKHLSTGYWKNETATREKFLHDPELGPLYRTGDLGRLMADGSIECMGRKDAQVKIRGFRIETGEIETRLLEHEAIKEVVVTVRSGEGNNDHICAYYTAASSAGDRGEAGEITVSELRNYLAGEIPDYMIPSYFIRLNKIPLTPNGKVDRKKLPEPEHIRPTLEVTYMAPETSIEKEISDAWKELLNLDKVGVDDNFFDLGGTSFDVIKLMSKLYYLLKKDIPVVTMFRYPTIRSFVRYLKQEGAGTPAGGSLPRKSSKIEGEERGPQEPIAVVGMSCRLPGSKNIEEFWENLKNGVESISHFSREELEAEGIDPRLLNDPNFVRSKGIIGDIGDFDAAFFNYSPTEARVMDPQLRIMHEISWEALEDAGCDPESYDGLIGLYAGNAANHYWTMLTYLNNISLVDSGFLVNNYSTIVSYKLNLKGPSFVLQTACSTSLVAIHLACRGLSEGECDIALAGGVSLWFPEKSGYTYQPGMIYSPDGHCRTFDAKAGGTVFGNGAGMVALKRLEDALADGDTIHAVVKGTGINNDGRRKVGFTSPSVEGQAELIGRVLRESRIPPESITYIEAHGTATVLGDPVELEALRLSYDTGKKGYCRIGSVKSNVGHLNIAAGVAGFIKAVLTIKKRKIPPSLHFETPNPKIDFDNGPFVVNTRLTEWTSDKCPLRAAVSAFGIGGTNAHAILEEPPAIDSSSIHRRPLKMLLLSAASRPALEKSAENLGNYLKTNPHVNLADVAYTLQVGRKTNKLRKMLLCSTVEEAVNLLLSPEEAMTLETGKIHTAASEEDNKRIVFMFSGQGAQYVNMGLELYQTEPLFRSEMDRCFEILNPIAGYDIKEILFPPSGAKGSYEEKINQTEITQPLLFIFEYSLARLLTAWGFTPYAMIGHSIGEYAAACLSGVFSLEDAIDIVALRGRLMQQMPGGSMVGVPLPEEDVIPLLTNELALAAVNTTTGCVVSGPREAINSFEGLLNEKGHNCRHLHTSHAFHSGMMDPILEEFERAVGRVTLNEPSIPYISNVTGSWITVEEAVSPVYWSKHLRGTVRFADGLTELFTRFRESDAVFVEVGPGRTLSTLVRQHKDKKAEHLNLNLIRHPKETDSDCYYLLSRIGRLWLDGKKIDWQGFYPGERRRRVPLPTYPFQKQRYWLEGSPGKISAGGTAEEPFAGKRTDISQWFYIPSWNTTVIPAQRAKTGKSGGAGSFRWMLFTENQKDAVGPRLREALIADGHEVVTVHAGEGFVRAGDDEYTVNPGETGDYRALLSRLESKGKLPHKIVHLWNLSEKGKERVFNFYSLIHLARAVGKENLTEKIQLTVLTDRMQVVKGDELLNPETALVLGALKVIQREYPNILCRSIDIDKTNPGPGITVLVKELLSGSDDAIVAFRDKYRWVRTFEPLPLEAPIEETPRLRENGVYLVTGGLGGIGLVFAQFLAEKVSAKLVLTGRSTLPPRGEWDRWQRSHGENDPTTVKIKKIRALEAAGADVLAVSADVSDAERMREVIGQAEEQFGKINAVIHSAGIADGGLIQVRTKEISERVFASKIDGTLVLDSLLKETPLDFFMLCSSISSITGTLGQVAYSAANTFLDHFAYYKTAKDNTFTVSVNWDAWQEVGMAVEAVKQLTRGGGRRGVPDSPRDVSEVEHPMFDRCETYDSDHVVYVSNFRAGESWFLDEHRVMEKATMPGTAYLEMARAAFEHFTQNGAVELWDFFSTAPLMITDDEEKEVRIVLTKNGRHFTFSIISRLNRGEDKWMVHARGKIASLEKNSPEKYTIKEIEAACNEKEIVFNIEEYDGRRDAIFFGPRWNNLRRVKFGPNRALGLLELPREFAADVETYKLHPAMVDVGNLLLRLLDKKSHTYVPAFYKRLKIIEALPGKVFFHVRGVDGNKPGGEALRYNITVMDEWGNQLVDIEEYTLRKIEAETQTARQYKNKGAGKPSPRDDKDISHPFSFFMSGGAGSTTFKGDPNQLLKDAVSPAEGIEVFRRILGGEAGPQVVVSTISLPHRVKKDREASGKGPEENGSTVQKLARPELSTDYVAPKTETEKILAPIWQELLGIEQVGVYDDFFELGGDSLKAVNFGSHIHKKLNIEVPVSEFFTRPNIKMLAQYIAENTGISQFHSIEPAERKEYYPLSSAQKRLYILSRLEGRHTGYNLFIARLMEGHVDIEKMEEIPGKIISRHETFRTSFEMVDGEPVQRVHDYPETAFELEHYNCTEQSGNEGNRKSPEDVIGEFVRPFDLSKAPLIRVGLVKLTENSHLLITDVHHIVFDGISYSLFYKEFAELYTGKELPPLKLQYKDFAEWQNARDEKKKEEEFWLKAFAVEPPILNLPLDFPRPAIQSFEGSNLFFRIEKEETDALRALVKKNEATLFMVLLLVVNVLLMKLSGQEDIVVGTPVSGRNHMDLEPLLGMFVNTVVLRNYPSVEKTVEDFLKELKENALTAFENQEYPFEKLVEKVRVGRDLRRNPLFDVMFILNSYASTGDEPRDFEGDLKLKRYEHAKTASQFDLTFTLFDGNDFLSFDVEYCTKLFKRESVERFVDYFRVILGSILRDSGRRLSEIEIISPEEKNRLLYRFNDTELQYPGDKTIHRLFEEQVERRGENIAVTGGLEGVPGGTPLKEGPGAFTYTYRELNEISDRLALRLTEIGARNGTVTAIMVERTPAMMVGLLGILKAGGAYMTLDPEYPAERIKYILEKSGTRLLLTQGNLAAKNTVSDFKGEIVDIFDQRLYLENRGLGSVTKPENAAAADDCAYVIYTSGSTGNPKGVMVRHRNAVNFIEGMAAKIDFSAGKTILALTTISFDIFFLETLLPVTRGMRVVIASEVQQKDPALLKAVVLENGVDMLQVTPTRLQLLLNMPGGLTGLEGVSQLLVGGEAFPPRLFGAVKETFPGQIYNVYGPTETTIWSTVKELSLCTPGELTIGGPMANTRIYIVDREIRPQPTGVAGELLIGGDGVAAGYLNNVELTAEKFIESPFNEGERLYRTGDLARWLSSREIEFIGRLDHQVKIRGFRIELEEIEEQLLKQAHIKEAVVVVTSNDIGDKYLCSYIVPRRGGGGAGGTEDGNGSNGIDVEDLRNRLTARLPSYMIPSYFTTLESIPLTPNGKIDRKALPEPKNSRTRPAATYVAPKNDNQKIIADIWKEILQTDRVGIHDNFFSLGGTSLNVVQLNWKLKETFGKEIPVALMFRNLSIGFLDSYLSEDLDGVEAEKEIKRTETLDKGRNTYKKTMAKLTVNRRTT